ncbi:hypothetical protein GGI20_002032 [Coemansia sp. BCRC 34301]|nr:hypothetical protein GGI20_002032 [Coemansia sp. BCRC 34301]
MRFNILVTAAGVALSLASSVFGGPIIMGYYPSWKRAQSATVDWSKYTHVNIAFSIPRQDGTFTFEDDWVLPQMISQVRAGGAKVLMSVGGWTGSNFFSTIVKSASARSTMISSMVNYVKTNNLDGIDIDWEYPGRLGNTCNIFDEANDTPNFLAFLQDLRTAFDTAFGVKQRLITLAVRVQPFDIGGVPAKDVAAFAKVIDYANLMQYDINGGWNTKTGPNAPFNFQPGEGLQVSFVSAIDDWVNAGFPANQLTAGIGFYGRSTIASQDMTKDPTNQYQPQQAVVPLGDSEDAPWYDACAGSTANSGVWMWKHLRDQGVLTSPATAAAPWVRQWDPVSQTPWLFNPSTKQFISYDDPQSLQIKVNYAASRGLAGAMVWSANMDYNNELMNVLHSWPAGPVVTTSPPATTSATKTTSSAPGTSTTSYTTATMSTTASTSSTAAPSSSSSTGGTGGGPVAGGACSSTGAYQCADASGKKAGYFLCLYGKWVAQSCGSGTICVQSGSSISCGWP